MEFQLIKQCIASQNIHRNDVILGIGDDAAITQAPANQQLVTVTDTLISGVHFPVNTPAHAIGYKSLAVNLSDIAAMAAEPAWASLALTIPAADESWLRDFMSGFFQLADQYNVQLIGGDTTQGVLTISVTVQGFVPPAKSLLRNNAQVGDYIYVTGCLGDAGYALSLEAAQSDNEKLLLKQLQYPQPQIKQGLLLRGIANSAIDISDGLLADLQHILDASKLGASVCIDNIPLSQSLLSCIDRQQALLYALSAGDDYQLCFTVPESKIAVMEKTLTNCFYIGRIEQENRLRLHDKDNLTYSLPDNTGYQHFGAINEKR